MTHYTPLQHMPTPNGKVHLASQVVRLDDHRRIYRRPRPANELYATWAVLIVCAMLSAIVWLGLIWIVLAIGRAVLDRVGG